MNPCKHEFCTYGPNDVAQIITTIEECDKKCPLGSTYILKDSPKCCGECRQTHCVFDNKLYKPNDKWLSADGCISYTCVENEWHLMVSSFKEICPSISHCRQEDIVQDGCCKICKTTSNALCI